MGNYFSIYILSDFWNIISFWIIWYIHYLLPYGLKFRWPPLLVQSRALRCLFVKKPHVNGPWTTQKATAVTGDHRNCRDGEAKFALEVLLTRSRRPPNPYPHFSNNYFFAHVSACLGFVAGVCVSFVFDCTLRLVFREWLFCLGLPRCIVLVFLSLLAFNSHGYDDGWGRAARCLPCGASGQAQVVRPGCETEQTKVR